MQCRMRVVALACSAPIDISLSKALLTRPASGNGVVLRCFSRRSWSAILAGVSGAWSSKKPALLDYAWYDAEARRLISWKGHHPRWEQLWSEGSAGLSGGDYGFSGVRTERYRPHSSIDDGAPGIHPGSTQRPSRTLARSQLGLVLEGKRWLSEPGVAWCP